MAVNFEEINNRLKATERTKEDILEAIRLINQALDDGEDLEESVATLKYCASSFQLLDEEIIDKLLPVAYRYATLAKTEKVKSSGFYACMLIYMKLGFAPKKVEYALKLIMNDEALPLMRYVAFTELMGEAMDCFLNERAYSYGRKMLLEFNKLNDDTKKIHELTCFSNYAEMLLYANRMDEFNETMVKVNEIIRDNPDDENVQGLAASFGIDMISAIINPDNISERQIREFVTKYEEFSMVNFTSENFLHNVTADIKVLRGMYNKGALEECMKVCRIIIDKRGAFVGNLVEIFMLTKELADAKPSLLTKDEYYHYRALYHEALGRSAIENASLQKLLVSEVFKMEEMNAAYDVMKVKYETDSLTVAYNRPSFEMNAADFATANPDGSLAFIDMDGLKYTNDHFGHSAGDFLLKKFVSIFNSEIDIKGERLYRYAGDEFILVTYRSPEETEAFLNEMLEKIKAPCSFHGNEIPIIFSFGVAGFDEISEGPFNAVTINAAVKVADGRMFECKARHKAEHPEIVRS